MIIRKATSADAKDMTDILNQIIAVGGTTAHQHAKTVADVRQDYIEGADVISAVVAEAEGKIIGWQSVELWRGELHIGTFVRHGTQAKGIGVALFGLTRDTVWNAGHRAINASIRADNAPGLAYYAKLGFVDFAEDRDYALDDGTIVGRVHRRLDLV